MSTPATPVQPARGTAPAPSMPKELRIYGHSAIFYWWPVWAFGYLMALITWVNGGVMAVLPPHSTYLNNNVTIKEPLPPQHQKLVREGTGEFYIHIHPSKNLGVFYTIIILVVIFITNFPLRGLSSALAVAAVVVVALLFSVMGVWDTILGAFGTLAVFMNLGFYLFFSTVLFIIWFVVTFIFDRFHYWRITPGQITHEYVFGGGQVSFDTEGIAIKKHRDDLFRHWVLGIGSGDIIMYPMQSAGSSREEMAIQNVLFVGSKLQRIQQLIAVQPE